MKDKFEEGINLGIVGADEDCAAITEAIEFIKLCTQERRLEYAIKELCANYTRAKEIKEIQNPLAWAFYQEWKVVDEKGVKK
jgi:hypothetical protein